MVQLEEVEDADLKREQPGPFEESFGDDGDYTDTDSSLSSDDFDRDDDDDDDDDDAASFFPHSESLTDRIVALRDIIPPSTRHAIASTSASVFAALKTSALYSGKGLYVIGTGGLLVLVPYMIALIEEQQIVEMEREQKAREMGSEILSPGAQVGGGAAKPGGL